MAQTPKQVRRALAALRGLEEGIAKAFKDAIQQAAGSVDFDALVRAIDARDIAAAAELLRINPATLFPVDEAIRSAFMAGGALVSPELPGALRAQFSFDGRHRRAEEWVRENVGGLIEGIQEQSLEATRRAIREGIEAGRSSTDVARQITGKKVGRVRAGGILGLNSDQAESIDTARRILSDPDQIRSYFVRDKKTGKFKPRFKLSDRRFDSEIIKAINGGRAIKGALLERIIAAHQSKALGYRGRVIAKSEAFAALAAGREEGFTQVQENPLVDFVSVRWQHNLSEDPREDHVAMDGTVIKLGGFFTFDDALMKHPHDAAGGAKHSIGCRCIAFYRVRMKLDA